MLFLWLKFHQYYFPIVKAIQLNHSIFQLFHPKIKILFLNK